MAHDLLGQICFDKHADIILISEQYWNRHEPGWYTDNLGTAAIWNRDPPNIHITDHGSGSGFVWVRHKQTYYVSVYLTPNQSLMNTRLRWRAWRMQSGTYKANWSSPGTSTPKLRIGGKPGRTVEVA